MSTVDPFDPQFDDYPDPDEALTCDGLLCTDPDCPDHDDLDITVITIPTGDLL